MNVLLDAGVAIYVAMATALIVWVGVFLFIWRIDQATKALVRHIDTRDDAVAPPQARIEIKKETAHE